jgi:3-hydroxyacyl-CoA dehydrogenase
MPVSLSRESDVAVVTVENPPVNALSQAVRAGLLEAMTQTEVDASVRAVVLICAGRTFFAGADVHEFGQPPAAPSLSEVLRQIERTTKPWVAAIHGRALGGGLETAMACRFRIAAPGTELGLPEVTLGLIPGAGGTILLPRLMPADRALEMIGTGKSIKAEEALAAGLVDALSVADLLQDAVTFARTAAARPLPPPAIDRPPFAEAATGGFEAAAKRIDAKARGQQAPAVAVQALRASLVLPVAQALVAEAQTFNRLKDSAQSQALRYIFFAERQTARDPRVAGLTARPLTAVGVVGGGTMGAGIAAACLLSGLSVAMVERHAEAVAAGRQRVEQTLMASQKRGLLSAEAYAAAMAKFTATDTYPDLAAADLVIEAVFEDMAVKHQVFAELDAVTRPDAVLASNTSYLDLNALAAVTRDPSRILGLHFFSPAHVMKLLEIVTPNALGGTALATGLALARQLGKVPVLAGVCDGFIANRIMSAYRREAEFMLEDGALPWQVDQAMTVFGLPMGIFQMQDLAGLDISWAMRKRQAAMRASAARYVEIGDRLCELGRFGRKSGRGYYLYPADGPAQTDPEVEALILAESARKGIQRRAMSGEAIMGRILSTMQAEGRRILEEGIARSAADIDAAMVNAYGFPRWKGGPMFLAEWPCCVGRI